MPNTSTTEQSPYHSFLYAGYRLLIDGFGQVLWYVDDDRYLGTLTYPEHMTSIDEIKANIKQQ